MKKVAVYIFVISLASCIAFAFHKGDGGDWSSRSSQCSSLAQNSQVYFQSIRLSYSRTGFDKNGESYTNWTYDKDWQEFNNAHWGASDDGNQNYHFSSLESIMDCYDTYFRDARSRVPSITVTYSGKCKGNVTINYYPMKYDANHCYSIKSLIGAPLFSPSDIIKGAMTIKSIKTENNGLQLKWQYTIESNDVLNLDEISTTKCQNANIAPLTLNAILSSSVPKNTDRFKTIPPVAARKTKEMTKSGTASYVIVENTVPKDLAGKTVSIIPTDEVIYSPQLDGPIYLSGEYSTDVKWNKPLVYGIIVNE